MTEVRMLTTHEVAEQLRVKPITVQRWLAAGKMRGTKLPGARSEWRIPESEVTRLIEQGKTHAA